MPNTINSRGRSSKSTGGYVCTSPHPTKGTDDSVQENHPMRWAGRGPYRSGNARGAGMGLCVLPGFQFRLFSHQGLDLVSVACSIHQPFLGLETIVTSEKQQRRLPVTLIQQAWYHFISTVTLEGTCCHRSHFTKENKAPRGQITCCRPHSS